MHSWISYELAQLRHQELLAEAASARLWIEARRNARRSTVHRFRHGANGSNPPRTPSAQPVAVAPRSVQAGPGVVVNTSQG